jgi:nitroreductase
MEEFFSSKNDYRESAEEINIEEFKKVIESRRSVRRYTSEPIPEDIVRDCLDMALLAPNSSNLQQWQFYWVRSSDLRAKLNTAFFSQPAATTAPELIVAVARTATWKKHQKQMIETLEAGPGPNSATAYYKKIVPLAYTIGWFGFVGFFKSLLFFLIGLTRPMPREVTSKAELQIWAVKSTALACENLMLAFRAYGYDSCPMEGLDSRRVRKLLKLPRDAVIVMGISAGRRADNGVYGPRVRFEKSQFIQEV